MSEEDNKGADTGLSKPTLWLVLLAIPVVLALLSAMFSGGWDAEPGIVESVVPQQQVQTQKASRYQPQRGQIAPPEETISLEKIKACDFGDWIGKPLKKALLKRHDKPYRVVVAGGDIKPSGNPLVLTIEIDSGVVTRVWCG